MKQQNPMLRLWELGEAQHGSLIQAILSAVVGVLCGMAPYFAAAQIILGLLSGNQEFSFYLTWCAVALAGFLLRASLYSLALSISHKATFSILKSIREKILEKLPKMPLGTILDTSSGQMKQVIVDQVESMERPLAHLLPEMTANVLGPVCILVYLFVLDWRMALLSLVSIPVGMAFMMAVMANYGKQYEGSVKTTQAMNSAIVEYIGGIEVIKAFNQGKQSYARFSDSVKGQRLLLLPLDEELPAAHLPVQGHLPHHHDHHSAGGLAPVCRRESAGGDLHHHHRAVPGHRRAAALRHGLCGQSGQGGNYRGLSGRDFER